MYSNLLEKQRTILGLIQDRKLEEIWKNLDDSPWCRQFSSQVYLPEVMCASCSREPIIHDNQAKEKVLLRRSKVSTFSILHNKEIVFDNTSYFVFGTWFASSVTSGIVEIFDYWKCGNSVSFYEEKCEPYSESYRKEFEQQVKWILEDLSLVGFCSRKLTVADFYVRLRSFSYMKGNEHRKGEVKICLRLPIESCFEGYLSPCYYEKLYPTMTLLSCIFSHNVEVT